MTNEEQSENLSDSPASDSEETASSPAESVGTTEEEGSATASGDASEEVSKLRQAVAKRDGALIREAQRRQKMESQLAEIDPYARIGLALAKAPGGEAIIEKLRKGEPLTAGETRKVVNAADTAAGNGSSAPAFDPQQLQTLIAQTVGSLLDQRELSQRQLTKLVGRAEKELVGFADLKESPAYLGAVDAVRVAVENGSLAPPEDEDRHYFIMKSAYNMLLAANPEIARSREEASTAERTTRAEKKALAGSLETARTRTEGTKLTREQEENVRLLQRWSVGRRFAGPKIAR